MLSEAARIAFINSQCVAAQAEIAGMQAENDYRLQNNLSPAYGEQNFDTILRQRQLDNPGAVLIYLETGEWPQ